MTVHEGYLTHKEAAKAKAAKGKAKDEELAPKALELKRQIAKKRAAAAS